MHWTDIVLLVLQSLTAVLVAMKRGQTRSTDWEDK